MFCFKKFIKHKNGPEHTQASTSHCSGTSTFITYKPSSFRLLPSQATSRLFHPELQFSISSHSGYLVPLYLLKKLANEVASNLLVKSNLVTGYQR